MTPKYLFLILFFIVLSFIIKMSKNSMMKIMCIGDSITFGPIMPGSYRKFLYNNLIKKGYKIKMVGVNSNKVEKFSDENNPESFE